MRTLIIPPAAQRDEKSIHMISAWIAEKGLHCTLNIGMWGATGRDEANAWGIFLADVVRHVANAIEAENGSPAGDTAGTILSALQVEFNHPTSDTSGSFHPGHS